MSVKDWLRSRLGRPAPAVRRPLGELEFALIDADLTGTDRRTDRVLGIAVLPLAEGSFRLGDLRYCRFPAGDAPSAAEAAALRSSYDELMGGLENRIVVTYNPHFVAWMLAQAAARLHLPEPPGDWLDIAVIARLIGTDGNEATSMPHWLQKMQAGGRGGHDAVYDVFAMAQLLQAVLAYAEDLGIETLDDLLRNQAAEDWMRPYQS